MDKKFLKKFSLEQFQHTGKTMYRLINKETHGSVLIDPYIYYEEYHPKLDKKPVLVECIVWRARGPKNFTFDRDSDLRELIDRLKFIDWWQDPR